MRGEKVQLIVLVFKLTKEQPLFKYIRTHCSFAGLPVDVGLVGSNLVSLVAIPTALLLHICKDDFFPFDLAFSLLSYLLRWLVYR